MREEFSPSFCRSYYGSLSRRRTTTAGNTRLSGKSSLASRSPATNPVNVTLSPNRTRRRSELSGPQRYLKIFCFLLSLSISPHCRRPTGSDGAGGATRQDAWKWLHRQCREKLDNSDWRHMDSVGVLRRILADALQEVADCEYPLYITPQMAGELIVGWSIADGRLNFPRI